MVHTTTCIEKEKEKAQKDKVGIDDIKIFEFIFHGLPNPPELEDMDEDRLRELQNTIKEQLCQRDEERERNITKRVQEFKKTFDFVNSHLLKGVVTMAELTKTDNRQPMGKIKPTDNMVMMPSLFDSTKPATSKQHYERFNLYINFQTKSGHLTDPVGKAIDLFEHMLDKTALVWFQMNRSKFKDLTMLKMMFLQSYNPWGKTKREQLQSWNISFDPKNTEEIPPPFKGAKPKQTRGRGKPKGKPQEQRQNPPKTQEADETYTYESPNNYYHNDNYTAPGQS